MGRKSIRVQAHENDFLSRDRGVDKGIGSGISPNRFIEESITVTTGRGLTRSVDDTFVGGANEDFAFFGKVPTLLLGKSSDGGLGNSMQGAGILVSYWQRVGILFSRGNEG